MIKTELLELIANGENSGLEFKRDDLRPEKLAKEIVALANLKGGRILLGVEDDGTVTGIQRDNLEEWVMDTVFGRYVHPMITPYYEEINIDDGLRVAVITLDTGLSKPYVVRQGGREDIYIRIGSTSRLASREQQMRLHSLGGMLNTEELPVSGSDLSDLSMDRLEDYLKSFMRDKIIPKNDIEWSSHLCKLGFMTKREDGSTVCTVAGLVLFGHSPRRLLYQAGLRWMAFPGTDKVYEAQDDQVIDAPLVPLRRESDNEGAVITEKGLIDRFLDVIRPFVSEEQGLIEGSMRRERKWHYPEEAMREAITNAIVHRDWTRNEEAEVVRYSDRLEFQSPGSLSNSMTLEKIIAGNRSVRNPKIVDVLRDYGYVETRGLGIRNKIIPSLLSHNGREPKLEATEDYFKLIMYRESVNPGKAKSEE